MKKLNSAILSAALMVPMATDAEAGRVVQRHAGYARGPRDATARHPRPAQGGHVRAPHHGQVPHHLRSGVRVGAFGFNSGFYYYSGFQEYVNGGMFFPFGYGPFVDNWSRGPPIGYQYQRAYGFDANIAAQQPVIINNTINVAPPADQAGAIEAAVNAALAREYARRNESTPVPASAPAPEIPEPAPVQEKRDTYTFGYGEKVCDRVQFVGEVNSLLNYLFDRMAEKEGRGLHAYTFETGGKPYTAVLESGINKILSIKYDGLRDGISGPECVEFVGNSLKTIGINMGQYFDVKYADHACKAR